MSINIGLSICLRQAGTRDTSLNVAEAIYRHDRRDPHARGLFLACVLPLAEKLVHRQILKKVPHLKDIAFDVMYGGAINYAIEMFERGTLIPDTFERALYHCLKQGAWKEPQHKRFSHLSYQDLTKLPGQSEDSRLDNILSAKQLLGELKNLETTAGTRRWDNVVRFIAGSRPEEVLDTSRKVPPIDYKFVATNMGLTEDLVEGYISKVRRPLRNRFRL